jgi:hypothetical protein
MHVHITLILIHVNTQMQNTIVSSLDKKDKMAICISLKSMNSIIIVTRTYCHFRVGHI